MESAFKAGTGLLGATEPGQRVTAENVGELPPGSVVRIGDGSRLIHLHDDLWLWCGDCAWTYDRVERLAWRLDDKSMLCHLPVAEAQTAPTPYQQTEADAAALGLQDAVRRFFRRTRAADDITQTVQFASELYDEFVKTVREAEERGAVRERERCLSACSKVADDASASNPEGESVYANGIEEGANKVADLIRARSKE